MIVFVAPGTLVSTLKQSKLVYRLAQAAVLAALVGLSLGLSLTTSEGPDEVAHYEFVRYIAGHRRLPLTPAERLEAGYKADLPPLFYLLVGLPASGLELDSPPFFKTNRNQLRLNLVTGLENIKGWRMIKTEDPLRGQVLLWYLGRWLTLATGVAAVGLIFGLARWSAPAHPWLALAAVALLASLPAFIYTSSVTNYEPLTAALMAAYVWLLLAAARRPQAGWRYLGMGLLLGLAAAARQSVWPVLAAPPLLLLWLAYHQRWRGSALLRRLSLYLLGLLLTFGLWLAYISIFFNRIAEKGWLAGLLSPIFVGDGSGHTSQQIGRLVTAGQIGIEGPAPQSDSVWQWLLTFAAGLWGGGWLLWPGLLLCGLVLVGLGYLWRQQPQQRLWLALLGLHLLLLLFFPFLRFLFSGDASTAVARHLLFPAAPIFVVGLVLGAAALPRLRPYLTGGMLALAIFYFAQSGWGLIQSAGKNDALPVQTVPFDAGEPTLAAFDTLTLLDSTLHATDRRLRVILRWRAEALSSQDYRLELSLLDDRGAPRARWLGQPLNARYPTRAWLPGDRVRDDIELPVAGLPPGEYRLQLRLLGDDGPLAAAGQPVTLELGRALLDPAPANPTGFLPLGDNALPYTFWPPRSTAAGLPVFKENQTVMFTLDPEMTPAGLTLSLVGPDGASQPPSDQTGQTVIFTVSPHLPGGEYRLRAEQWRGEQAVAQAETEPLLRIEAEARQFAVPDISRPASANFAGYVSLLGYDLPARPFKPGEQLPLTLYWQARRVIGADLVIFNHLIGPDGRQWGGRDRRPREVYSTMFWAPQEIVADSFSVSIDPAAPPGSYQLLVGLYLPVGEAPVSLPLVQKGQLSEVTSVSIGPIEIELELSP